MTRLKEIAWWVWVIGCALVAINIGIAELLAFDSIQELSGMLLSGYPIPIPN